MWIYLVSDRSSNFERKYTLYTESRHIQSTLQTWKLRHLMEASQSLQSQRYLKIHGTASRSMLWSPMSVYRRRSALDLGDWYNLWFLIMDDYGISTHTEIFINIYWLFIFHIKWSQLIYIYIYDFPSELRNSLAGTLSGGQKRRLSAAIALIGGSQVAARSAVRVRSSCGATVGLAVFFQPYFGDAFWLEFWVWLERRQLFCPKSTSCFIM